MHFIHAVPSGRLALDHGQFNFVVIEHRHPLQRDVQRTGLLAEEEHLTAVFQLFLNLLLGVELAGAQARNLNHHFLSQCAGRELLWSTMENPAS